MKLEYHTLDVFTDRVFGGNPLAVFPEANGLSDGLMQRIARELNLSETVFLSAPVSREGTRRVRIFTPAMEVPFAGHPTIGTALFLAFDEAVELDATGGRVVLDENVGPVPVDIEVVDSVPRHARFSAAMDPEFRPSPWDSEALAQMLSLTPEEIGCRAMIDGPNEGSLGAELVSVGLPFVVVPVRDLEAIRRSKLDSASWERHTHGAWSRMLYVVTAETDGPEADLHVRMYAPAAGVPEDPATGSAAAALAAYLGRRAPNGSHRWIIEQGIEMGRPSRLEIEADVENGIVHGVRVGGSAVRVSSGVMEIADGLR